MRISSGLLILALGAPACLAPSFEVDPAEGAGAGGAAGHGGSAGSVDDPEGGGGDTADGGHDQAGSGGKAGSSGKGGASGKAGSGGKAGSSGKAGSGGSGGAKDQGPTTCEEAHGSPGCCSADGLLAYEYDKGKGTLVTTDCGAKGQVCTWVGTAGKGNYRCAKGPTAADPGGVFPLACGGTALPGELTGCKATCQTDSECAGNPTLKWCDKSAASCVACLTNAHCSGHPDLPFCSPSNTCVECVSNSDCSAHPEGALCTASNTCGCAADADCHDPERNACQSKSCQDICTMPDFPQYCPGSGFCWGPTILCSTVTTCPDGQGHGCTKATSHFDCGLQKCIECTQDTDCKDGSLPYCIASQCTQCNQGNQTQHCAAMGSLPATCIQSGFDCSTQTICPDGLDHYCPSGTHVDCASDKCPNN